MDEIIHNDLQEGIDKFREEKLIGKVSVDINFYRGGISNYLVGINISKKIKNDTLNKNNLKNKNNA